jgi:hypothetical protein
VSPILGRSALSVRHVLWAIATLGVALSGFLLGVEALNHSSMEPVHVATLGSSVLVAALVSVWERRLTPLFAALAYGAMMASSVFVFGLGAAVLRTGIFPSDPGFRRVLLLSLVVLAAALPTVLIIRRRERSRASAI